MDRRAFLRSAVAAGASVIGGRYVVVLAKGDHDPSLRLRDSAPNPDARYGMLIDAEKCIGCHSCAIACRNEFGVPSGVWRSWVKVIEIKGKRAFLPRLCNHCDNPPCVPVCPVKATYSREDGLVLVREDRCIGCKACMIACPYNARFVHPVTSVVGKCTFCAHRIADGRLPACVEACPTRAMVFGDLNDVNSEIALRLRTAEVKTLKADLGTDCRVFYANADGRSFGRVEIASQPVQTVRNYDSAMPVAVRDAFIRYRSTLH